MIKRCVHVAIGSVVMMVALPLLAAKPVVLAVAEAEHAAPVSWYSGTVQSQQEARLSMEATGRLTAVATFGQTVKKGDVLAEVKADALTLQLKIEQMEARKAKAYVDHLVVELARLNKLAKKRNVSETDQAKARHDLAIRRIELDNARLQVNVIQEQLARTQLIAPFDGTVNSVFKSQGEYINQGESVLHLVNTAQQEIRLQAPISVTALLPAAATLDVTVGTDTLTATLDTRSASADARSRLMELRLLPQGKVMTIGQPVKVAIPTRFKSGGVLVPRDAIVTGKQGSALFVISEINRAKGSDADSEEIKVKSIPVDVLYSSGGKVAVKGDITIGREVVVRGASGLIDGQQVQLLEGS
ncbi:efflux RND transporter periplasmic adaptor subunit [Photobacterium japonica]|uniref:efflux RND transporter periplasmic adaptor subunit n=1 Tax=Photobacterium japonica TaxID=2910235 RepID=UPI003D13FFA5